MWWKHDGGSLEKDLKPFRDDGYACELAMFAFENNCEVKIFIEPKSVTGDTTFMEKVREKGKGNKYEEEVDKSRESKGKSTNEYVKGVHFDDGEKEMMKGFDEGMDEGVDEMVDEGLNEGVDGEPRDGENPNEPPNDIYITQEMGSNKMMPKHFNFKVGMEFYSLKWFKNAILEHNVLFGREVRFDKNDANRFRVVKRLIPKKKVKNNVDLTVAKRKSDKLRTLKARDIHSRARSSSHMNKFQVSSLCQSENLQKSFPLLGIFL
ncbi:hypothetical protein KIW84_044946 [Lathyrus oleraceus]|uniref:Uncharacterized protein n=1 Tax=Pisum sativum TaxID=3888 RepID=A0A9D4XHQ7_PEA|nr:hypothetical protein KIW84_044946 [Pisum sativum]